MNRRYFLMSAGGAAFAQKRVPAPPNILLIVADDLAAWHLGCYGNKEIRTPNIDTLARTGTRFVNNFVCSPICSASRATIFTGRTPRQHGIHDFLTSNPVPNPPQGQAAPPASFANEVMISDVLSGRGYDCGYVGKWHMGNDEKPGHGYGYSYTMKGGSAEYQNPAMYENGERRQESGYLTDLMTQRALGYLDKQTTAKPFFLTVGYFNPHTPYTGHPQKYYDMYAQSTFATLGWEPGAPNALREKAYLKDTVASLRQAAAATTALDGQIPLLMKKLQDKGLRDNTLIVFTSDNGYLLGRHGLWSKGHASDPINMYEEAVNVPLLFSWPGKIPAEAVGPDMLSAYDLFPTLCDVTGSPVPARNLVGRSYWPLARREPLPKKDPWKQTVFGHFRNTEMVRDKSFTLVLRNGGKGPNELFDIRADPREKANQYENQQFITVRDRMRAELDAWRKRSSS